MEKMRFGIIGCGVISSWHARAITALDEAELVAVCDIIPERAEKLSAEFGGKVYTDYHEMLASPDVVTVCICTPSGMHADMAIAAARAGKHVMTEKPIDINLAKIDQMIAECRNCGVKLGVIFQRRTTPMWYRIKAAIDKGLLGKMVLGDAYLKYYRSQEYYDSGDWRGTKALDGGGALMNQGVHMVDILQWIMGPVESIFAHADHLVRDIEVEDTTVAVLKFANGAFGVLEGTTSVVGMDHRLELHGDKGTITVDRETIEKWEVPEEKTSVDDMELEITIGSAATDPTAIGIEGHQAQILDLIHAICEDRDPMVTGEEARKAVEIILSVYQSAQTGQLVKLPLKP